MTETVACLVSEGELAWFSMCTLLVTGTVACLVSEGELHLFLMCTFLVTQMWPVFFQDVSWPHFTMHLCDDTDVALF